MLRIHQDNSGQKWIMIKNANMEKSDPTLSASGLKPDIFREEMYLRTF